MFELNSILKSLEKTKAIDVKVLDVRNKSSVADFFVIASGTSTTMVKALSGNLEKDLKKTGIVLFGTDGMQNGEWVVLDFGSVIVHVFLEEIREFYNLEKLWGEKANFSKFTFEE